MPTPHHVRFSQLLPAGVAVLALAGGARAQTAPAVLTLREAVQEALAHNERALLLEDGREDADLAVRLARDAFQPKLLPTFSSAHGELASGQTLRLDVSQRLATGTEWRAGAGASLVAPLGPGSRGAPGGRSIQSDLALTVTQPLLRGFGTAATRRALSTSELRRGDAERQLRLGEQRLAVEVADAYYRLVTQKTMVTVAKAAVDRARQLQEVAEVKLAAGLVSQLDVFRALQLVTQAETQLFDAEAAVDEARDQMRVLMGRNSGAPFEVVAEIPSGVDHVDADTAIARALDVRLDLQSALAAAEDADLSVAAARNDLLPQVDANLSLTRSGLGAALAGASNRVNAAAFLTVALPVDRTPQLTEFRRAQMDRERRQRSIDALRRQIQEEVRRAIRARDRAARTVAAADALVDIGKKEAEVARLRYESGLSNNLDVVTAEGNLLAAEARRVAALAERAALRWSLRAVMGTLDPRAVDREIAP